MKTQFQYYIYTQDNHSEEKDGEERERESGWAKRDAVGRLERWDS